MPAWLSDKKKKALRKDEEYRRRIELIQDFEFPAGCNRIKVTPDGQFIFASGYHPPQVGAACSRGAAWRGDGCWPVDTNTCRRRRPQWGLPARTPACAAHKHALCPFPRLQMRCYDVAQLSMKFSRHLDSEIVDFQILSDDYSKAAFLCADRRWVVGAAAGCQRRRC